MTLFFLSSITILLLVGISYFFFYQSKGIMRIEHLLELKREYAKKTTGPKRLIVGGSDVLYSFDTDRIEQETKQLTVNFGVNVGLGMGFLLDEVKQQIQPGDEVILCFAYSMYFKPAYNIFAYEYYRMFDKRKLVRFNWKQHIYFLLSNFKLNMTYKQKQFDISESGAYINVSGECLADRKNKPLYFPANFVETEVTLLLENFCEMCKKQDIRVRLTYPSTLGFNTYNKITYIKQLTTYLEENFDVIGKPADYFVSHEAIYNSVYHVNMIGQLERTERLLTELKEESSYV
ncbi:hypothetical protein HCI96_05620 [Listeria seeligeri]|uniref:hypothetical protein n=1 Tax=Listeria seeligeri TaxID=1640 RepID=UPI001626CB29|nr:hypothetical protein [Listeria seeligeri]MBC1826620.1 hypothetical protein [Listeria seeligeri]MBC1870024.1 hypothetical protein [Listeria seeligeri]MBM5598042.1 hypothetical protein [Listeria seeligeri]MBM5606501.1 hypothetical protein [Listeria seeligeri]MBM5611946.1 hypothetical protein [Listeria seeligeri]